MGSDLKTSSSDWTEYSIDELKASSPSAIAIGPFGSRMKSETYVSEGIPVIRGNNLSDTKAFQGDFVYISHEMADEMASCNVYKDDLVFPHRGSIGEVGIITGGPEARYMLSTSLMKLSVNQNKADPLFLFYFFRSPQGRHELLKNASTVGTPGIATPLASLRSIRLRLPGPAEQRAIARVLGSLDDKIELNRKMNATLEETARAIFQSWFVDFDPVRAKAAGQAPIGLDAATAALFPAAFEEVEGRMVPQRWVVSSLDQIATYLNGLALQKFPATDDDFLPVIKIAQMRKGNTEDSDKASPSIPEAYIIKDGDVLFSWSGSLEVVLWCGGRGALNQHLFKVTSDNYPKWFYYLWTCYHLPEFQAIAADKATTMGHIQRHHLTQAKVTIPTPEMIDLADKTIAPLIDQIIGIKLQSRTLAELRDTLLPRLLSGELRVRDVEPLL